MNAHCLASAFLALLVLPFAQGSAPPEARPLTRPWMFVSAEPVPGLRSLAELRSDIREGHASRLWQMLIDKVERELETDPWTPATEMPGRTGVHVKHENRDYTIVALTSNRILDASLAALITGERRYADAALMQLDALFDPAQWPDWEDKAHINVGRIADLRHGQLAFAVAVSYDWLYRLLSPDERERIIDGLDRCAIQRFKAAVEAGESWTRNRTNWMTVIVGGFGIAGLALGADHPDSDYLVEFARPRMEGYLDVLGEEGEFNESVQYAGSMMYLVRYFMAVRYASQGQDNPFQRHSLSDFCRWYMYMTFPPGRVAGFGDPAPDMPPVVNYMSAIAAATHDPMLQWFYLQYCDMMLETHRNLAMELIYFDARLDALSPEGRLPLGRAYLDEGMLISSRSSWDPKSTPSVVYSKAGRESTHSHADWGQTCIDGYGERLVIDLGAPPGYPKGHVERFYNYQQWGHNVFVFGHNETGGVPWQERSRDGSIRWAEFDDARGASWVIDLTEVYDTTSAAFRTVVHLLPRVVVVVDEAELRETLPISMRWHLAKPVEPDAAGAFNFTSGAATLAGRVARVDGPSVVEMDRHVYEEPYNRDRMGELYPQRHEPFVEIKTEDEACRIVSLFCVFGKDDPIGSWKALDDGWSIETPEGMVVVELKDSRLDVRFADSEVGWSVSAKREGDGSE
jgi:hypothetical protein